MNNSTPTPETTEVTLPGLAPFSHGNRPFCLKCQKVVDEVAMETPVETAYGWERSISYYTGEVRITVKCHGEMWKTSYWRDPEVADVR